MGGIYFLGEKFKTERERNSYVFQNKNWILKNKPTISVGFSFFLLFVGFIVGLMLFGATENFLLFIISLLGFPFVYIIFRGNEENKIEKEVEEYYIEHKEFLIETERKIRDSIFEPFGQRYSTNEQKVAHREDLINLINQKLKLNLTDNDIDFLIHQNILEKVIPVLDKIIKPIKDKFPNNIAKSLIKYVENINFENKEDYSLFLESLCEYLNRKKIEYDAEKIENEFISEYRLLKAKHFEEKLSRNTDEKTTVEEIELLDGFQFEQFIGNLFRKAGYKVTVTKKTGDQGADLVVEKEGISTAIQTKKYAGSVGNKAVQEVVAAMKFYDCDKSMVITTGTFTSGAYKLAGMNGVQLIDKTSLNNLLDSTL